MSIDGVILPIIDLKRTLVGGNTSSENCKAS
jgi:hypothetical protein